MTIMRPPSRKIEKFSFRSPKSQRLMGSTNQITKARPAPVCTTRSGTPSACSTGTKLRMMSETPSPSTTASSPLTPDTAIKPPRTTPTIPSDPPPPASLLDRRIGKVADRGDDVHAADTPGGECDDREREEDADRVGQDETDGLDRVRDVEVVEHRPERARHDEDHPVGDRDPDEDADRGRDHVVRDSFEQEHLHEMAAARADRARDPELTSPLGCEHDEDEEDKEDAGGDRERAERREDGHERRAGLIGRVQRVLLRVVGLEPELRKRGLHAVDDLSAQLRPALGPAGVRDEDRLYEPRLVQKALCLGEREKQAGAVRGPALVLARSPSPSR